MRVYTVYAVVALLAVSCGVIPLYDTAEIKEGWHTHQGFMFQDISTRWTAPSILFTESERYYGFQLFRFDIFGTYANNRFGGIVPHFGIGMARRKVLDWEDPWDNLPMIDAGLGLKFAVYPSSALCFSLKYDFSFSNAETGGQLFLMAGIKRQGVEKLTVSIFANPRKADYVDARVAAAGLNVAYRLNPKIAFVSGANFFFTQDLDRDEEPYIVFWFGVGF